MRILPLSCLVATLVCSAALAQQTALRFMPEPFRAHVTFLADDLLEGRDTASAGHEIAARYVASQFAAYGLTPAGDDGDWYQRVTFQRTQRGADRGSLEISGPAGGKTWEHAGDVLVWLNPNELELEVAAPLVFVGYGAENARLGLDDYRGLDVKGKIVVALRGYPKGLPSEEGAHVASQKAVVAQRHGAIGLLSLDTLQSAKVRPWKTLLEHADDPDFAWVDTNGKVFDETPAIRATGSLNTPAAEAVLAGSGRNLATILKEADRAGGKPRGFALKTSVRLRVSGTAQRVSSPNVVAMVRGADPALADEYVVLSAHLDHIGVNARATGESTDTDRINNGALDNAAGIATLLEVARAMAAAPQPPRRSVIFLASTAEEQGLLGADYYARHPTVPGERIVGNVDLDMPLLLYPFTDVIAFGANHSSIGRLVEAAVKPMGLSLAPDPMPEQGIFTRSDHYMFVKQGVPAVFLATGYANGGQQAWEAFLAGNYHHPGDDLAQKIDWDAGARFAEANYRITRALADGDEPPRWIEGDFFGDLFAPRAPRAPRR